MILNTLFESFYFYVILYFFIYNISALMMFWALINFFPNPSSLFSFKLLNDKIFIKILVSCVFLSLAGLPPFIGFFTKIFLINFLIFNQMSLNVIFFFILVMLMLYFYIQNFKIMFSVNNSKEVFRLSTNWLNANFYVISNYFIFFLILSPLSIDLLIDLVSNIIV